MLAEDSNNRPRGWQAVAPYASLSPEWLRYFGSVVELSPCALALGVSLGVRLVVDQRAPRITAEIGVSKPNVVAVAFPVRPLAHPGSEA